MSMITAIHPEFSVDFKKVHVGDKLMVGGPGATFSIEGLERYGLADGDEVEVTEVSIDCIKISANAAGFWSVERFSLPGAPVAPFKVGDRVRCLEGSFASAKLVRDQIYVVSAVHEPRSGGNPWVVSIDGETDRERSWFAYRFELVEPDMTISTESITADKIHINEPVKVVVIDSSIDVFRIPRRAYDFAKGDRRFLELAEATAHAAAEFERTGVQQLVRPDSKPDFLADLFVVQAFGS